MMKFSTKFSAILSICALMTICSVTPASATSQSYSNEDHGFVNDWEMVQGVGTWVIKYGYNTSWINEGYTHAYHTNRRHSAIVVNANGSFSDDANAGGWAKIEVRHAGDSVTYMITY